MEIQVSQILFQVINFSVVLGALTFLLYKPVLKLLEERSKRVEKAQKDAQQAELELEKLAEKKRVTQQEIDQEAAQIIAEARDNATKQAEQIISKAKARAKTITTQAQDNAQEQKQKLINELEKNFVDEVFTTAEKLLAESINKKQHQKLVEKELTNISKSL